jgi:multicomponent Na+:H+ antiporter subunit B
MSRIVRTVTSFTFPLAMIYGLYVIAHGHLTPGGGFQGGAIAASACAMVLVAFGSKWTINKIKEKRLSVLESLGALGFITLAFFGLVFGVAFFHNFLTGTDFLFGMIPETGSALADINTAGILPLMNFAVGLKVIAGLFVIVLVMAYASTNSKEDVK